MTKPETLDAWADLKFVQRVLEGNQRTADDEAALTIVKTLRNMVWDKARATAEPTDAQIVATAKDQGMRESIRLHNGAIYDPMPGVVRTVRALRAPATAEPKYTEDVLREFIEVEKLLCDILGRPWAPSGFSIETLCADIKRTMVRAPAATAEPRRFALHPENRHMFPSENGPWVRYVDRPEPTAALATIRKLATSGGIAEELLSQIAALSGVAENKS